MALIRCDFFSDVLELATSMTVLLPQRSEAQIGVGHGGGTGDPPLLYLLHGLSDDDTAWTRYTSIERYATERGLAVVMPQVHRSFYRDGVHGGRYWTFLSQELPAVVSSMFRVATRREDTYVAGLSMGGYGALVWGLRQPERFAAVASLSGVTDLGARLAAGLDARLIDQVFGTAEADPFDDPMYLVTRADPALTPPLYLACGTEDFLYEDNVRFADRCRDRGLNVVVDHGPGEHEWGYWDMRIRAVIDWLPRA